MKKIINKTEDWVRDYNQPKKLQPTAYIKTTGQDLDCDYDFVMHHLTKELNKMQDEILRGVLRQILDREPELEDAKLLTIIRYPDDLLDYSLAYAGYEVGRVIFEHTGTTWAITFKPLNER